MIKTKMETPNTLHSTASWLSSIILVLRAPGFRVRSNGVIFSSSSSQLTGVVAI